MYKILKTSDIQPDLVPKFSNSDINNGLVISFNFSVNNKWIGIFKKGTSKMSKIVPLSTSKYLVISNGLCYFVDTESSTVKSPNIEYNDFKVINKTIFFSSFSIIDVYFDFELKKSFIIDDIDGIKLKRVKNSRLHGIMRQIEERNTSDWTDFSIHVSTFDFECDKGRSWIEKTVINGEFKTEYLTMDLKNVSR